MTTMAANADVSAIDIFKQNEQVKTFLAKHTGDGYEIIFGEVPMGGRCGFVGCEWKKLVSLVITSKQSNAPSVTILAEVSGNTPDRGAKPTVRFVDLADMDAAKWKVQL